MKTKIIALVLFTVLLMIPVLPIMAEKPAVGFDGFGYNYQARVFVGAADGVDRVLDGKVWGDTTYANDHLVMKWSKAWDDARFHDDNNWTPDAWCNNEWNGNVPGGSGESEIVKIVWVGTAWSITGDWVLEYLGTYEHMYSLTQAVDGTVTGTGIYPATGDTVFYETITGTVAGTEVTLNLAYFSDPERMISTGYTLTTVSTINPDGTISGGGWTTLSGTATNSPENTQYWRDGGYAIWGEFEVIMDHYVGPDAGELPFVKATPCGYGVN